MRTRALTLLALAPRARRLHRPRRRPRPPLGRVPARERPSHPRPGHAHGGLDQREPRTGYLEGWLPEFTVVDERGGRHVRRGQRGEAATVFPRLPGGLLRVEASPASAAATAG